MAKLRNVARTIWSLRSVLLVVLTPLLLLPLPLVSGTKVARCGYGMIIMAVYWITEAIPLEVTSLLPVFLFPVLGVSTAAEVCSSYIKNTLMLFMGSLIAAVAIEKWNLHKRIALRVLTLVGSEPRWLLFGIMLPTWFLSMWMSNTATTAMMLPILQAVILQLKGTQSQIEYSPVSKETGTGNENAIEIFKLDDNRETINGNKSSQVSPETDGAENGDKRAKHFQNISKTFSLSLAYAANIGGIATLTGTPPNAILKGQVDIKFEKYNVDSGVNFASWLVLALPVSIICFICCWIWLQISYAGKRMCYCYKKENENYSAVKKILKDEYEKLGRMSFAEAAVLVHFVILAVLWLTRKPGFIPGWSSLFAPRYVGDSTNAILIAAILFVFPSKIPFFTWRSNEGSTDDTPPYSYSPLLEWDLVQKRLPWGVLVLMGGGFALADSSQKSGLSAWIGNSMEGFKVLPPWIICLLLSLIVTAATEITSNSATTTILLPIVAELGENLHINPLYFMMSCTIAASFAFMLPVATPPNAIVFSTGYLRINDMMKTGIVMNIITAIILSIAINTWGNAYFRLYQFPFDSVNVTASPVTTSPP